MTRPQDIAPVHGPRPGAERVLGRYGERDTHVDLAVAPGGAALARSSTPYAPGGVTLPVIPHIDDPLPRPVPQPEESEPKQVKPKAAKQPKEAPFTPARAQSQIEARLAKQQAANEEAEERFREHLVDGDFDD